LKIQHQGIIVLLVITFNYGIDRITKTYADIYLNQKGTISIIGDYFILVLSKNKGAFLSLGINWNIYIKYTALLIVPICLCIFAIIYTICREKRIYRIILIPTIVGGGLGNLIDRLFNNFQVIDFMNFGIGNIRTGILNVADLSVTFGVIVLIILELKHNKIEYPIQ
jgi:signal peptidase II